MGFLVLALILLFIWLYGGLCYLLGMVSGYRDRDRYDELRKEALYMKAIYEDLV